MTLDRRHRPFRSTGQWETHPPLTPYRKVRKANSVTSSANQKSSSQTKTCFRATWVWKGFPLARQRGRAGSFACPRRTAWTAGTTPRWRTTAACRRRPRTRRYSCEERSVVKCERGRDGVCCYVFVCVETRFCERKLFVLWDYSSFCKLSTIVFVSVRGPVATRDIFIRKIYKCLKTPLIVYVLELILQI